MRHRNYLEASIYAVLVTCVTPSTVIVKSIMVEYITSSVKGCRQNVQQLIRGHPSGVKYVANFYKLFIASYLIHESKTGQGISFIILCFQKSRVSVTQLREKPTGSKQTQPSSTHMTSTNIKQRGSLDTSSNELYIVYYIYIYISVFVIHNYTHHIITYYWIPYPTL